MCNRQVTRILNTKKMRLLLFVSLLLTSGVSASASEIDELRTEKEVVRFIEKRVDSSYWYGTRLFNRPENEDSTRLSGRFFKWDIDGDGRTDLIVNYHEVLVVMDRGNGRYIADRLINEYDYFKPVSLDALDSSGGVRKLAIRLDWYGGIARDTLVYENGGFTEYNGHATGELRFDSIQIRTTRCFGTCPVFTIGINSAGQARYIAEVYNKKKGIFFATLSRAELNSLFTQLRGIGIDRLRRFYTAGMTDQQSILLDIWYNGKGKHIYDYGQHSPTELKALYGFFFRLRETIRWRK